MIDVLKEIDRVSIPAGEFWYGLSQEQADKLRELAIIFSTEDPLLTFKGYNDHINAEMPQ